MTTKTKKIIFWAVIAALVIGILLWLKFASFGSSLMGVILFAAGLVVGGILGYFVGKIFRKS